jgi:hypothetical protein
MAEQGFAKFYVEDVHVFWYHNTSVYWDDMSKYQKHHSRWMEAKNSIFIALSGGYVFDWVGYHTEFWTDIDYNIYDHQSAVANPWSCCGTGGRATLAAWQSATCADGQCLDANSYDVNYEDILNNVPSLSHGPFYAADEIARVHLTLKSTPNDAIDNGEILNNINDGYFGSAPDMGAYEYNDNLPQYGPRTILGTSHTVRGVGLSGVSIQ